MIAGAGWIGLPVAIIASPVEAYESSVGALGIEVFQESISLTNSNLGTGLIDFFERNDGRVVYIDNFIDVSMAVEENRVVEERCGLDIDAVVAGNVNGVPLPLPVYENIEQLSCSGHYMVLNIGENTTYEYSSGGTGIVMVRFEGFFEVSATYHSGPRIFYHLKEVEVPFEVRDRVVKSLSM
ncbi:hypothetical protein LG302_13785 [Halomonas organivorans]